MEFTFFQTTAGTRLLSQEIVVGAEHHKVDGVTSQSLPMITEKEFLASADEYGRPLFSRIIGLAQEKSLPVHWGTKGFSLNADYKGTHVAICLVYPPDSVYRQTIRTALYARGGVERKTAVPAETIARLKKQAEAIGVFTSAGEDLKCHITRDLSHTEIEDILHWCLSVAGEIKKYGLKE
ncbi:hypothetical protein [Chitinivibrio alkaliphilus]|uniref:Uncharacterized protein n=1 Tax=Chitinivibrio alkaliphilus ACht1 TaxID=1313304 RepID=U7DE77_9BACT|nr:hypothetical protein [Chitinivibrio alkaliphilus]ERP39226.1 hypothetical protein CALK_0011 [Chitinivibrio alkaliphilus ACht1]